MSDELDDVPEELQDQRIALQHVGYRSERTMFSDHGSRLERSLAHTWMETCEREHHGYFLDLVLECDDPDEPQKVTQRDARVAATIVQWLGINVGMGFLTRALEKGGYKIVRANDSE